jgi:hypothetical protein
MTRHGHRKMLNVTKFRVNQFTFRVAEFGVKTDIAPVDANTAELYVSAVKRTECSARQVTDIEISEFPPGILDADTDCATNNFTTTHHRRPGRGRKHGNIPRFGHRTVLELPEALIVDVNARAPTLIKDATSN